MAQIPKSRLVKGPYKPICRDCAIYFSITVSGKVTNTPKLAKFGKFNTKNRDRKLNCILPLSMCWHISSRSFFPWKVTIFLKVGIYFINTSRVDYSVASMVFGLTFWVNFSLVEPTHLKNMSEIGNLPQVFGVKIPKKMKPLHRALIWVFPKIGAKPPKWMVKIMENPYEQMDDLEENPQFSETSIYASWWICLPSW